MAGRRPEDGTTTQVDHTSTGAPLPASTAGSRFEHEEEGGEGRTAPSRVVKDDAWTDGRRRRGRRRMPHIRELPAGDDSRSVESLYKLGKGAELKATWTPSYALQTARDSLFLNWS